MKELELEEGEPDAGETPNAKAEDVKHEVAAGPSSSISSAESEDETLTAEQFNVEEDSSHAELSKTTSANDKDVPFSLAESATRGDTPRMDWPSFTTSTSHASIPLPPVQLPRNSNEAMAVRSCDCIMGERGPSSSIVDEDACNVLQL